MRHRDSTGAEGLIGPGGAQWMTAGRGVLHSEFPEPDAQGRVLGCQLRLNLPAGEKMRPAAYRDIAPDEVPEATLDGGGVVRLIAGRLGDATGPGTGGAVDPLLIDLRLAPGGRVAMPLPHGHAAFAYLVRGTVEIGAPEATRVPEKHLAVLDAGTGVTLANTGSDEARLIVAAARPLNEPVVAYGPFVMNTEDEIRQAFRDFQSGNF